MIKKLNASLTRHVKTVILALALLSVSFGIGIPTTTKAAPSTTAVFGNTEALLLNCIDYRLNKEVENYMESRGMAHKYDQVVLAGASLGAHNKKFPSWEQTFLDHVDVAISLHHIHKVIVMDHRDCGAYRVILGYEDLAKDRAKETKVHQEQLDALSDIIQAKHPDLEVETLIMDLDGKVEKISEHHSKESTHH